MRQSIKSGYERMLTSEALRSNYLTFILNLVLVETTSKDPEIGKKMNYV